VTLQQAHLLGLGGGSLESGHARHKGGKISLG
jgi:hypothetical protein